EGEMEVGYDNRTYDVGPNSFVFLDCYEPHFYRATSDHAVFSWIHFTGAASREHFEELHHYNGCVFSLKSNWKVSYYLEQILTMMEKTEVDEQLASILIQRVFYELDLISNRSESN